MKYAIIGVEGPHDQAFVGKVLRLLGFQSFQGEVSHLDKFWDKFIPKYPKKGNLYKRLDMPSILYTEKLSVAIYSGEGKNLVTNLDDIILNNYEYQNDLTAFGIVVDADKESPNQVVQPYFNCFEKYFPNFPNKAGLVNSGATQTGIYILPDNNNLGVLDMVLCECGLVSYPEYMKRAQTYLEQFSQEEQKELKWKPFDREKALVAIVVSVLKPGKTNTVSLADNHWVSNQTETQVVKLANFINFIKELLQIIN